jgi:hypothetical protein
MACSAEFELGFKDGFTDYLYAGGTGEPPPVPPRCLWNLDYRTPRGRQAADDWFAGFRCGAAVVRENGYREKMLLPSSLSTSKPAVPPAVPMQLQPGEPFEVIPTPISPSASTLSTPAAEKTGGPVDPPLRMVPAPLSLAPLTQPDDKSDGLVEPPPKMLPTPISRTVPASSTPPDDKSGESVEPPVRVLPAPISPTAASAS